jgi:hypothetical protein
MSKLMTKANDIKQSIKRILESQSLLSIDEEDFGDYEKIIGCQFFKLIDESSEFDYTVDKEIANITSKLIVNTAYNGSLTLAFLERILSKIRMSFDSEIEVIYGHSNGFHEDNLTIDVFLIKK